VNQFFFDFTRDNNFVTKMRHNFVFLKNEKKIEIYLVVEMMCIKYKPVRIRAT